MTSLTDKTMRDSVVHELEWEPTADASHIGVTASDGAIVLSGIVPDYAARWESVCAAERVYGVRAGRR